MQLLPVLSHDFFCKCKTATHPAFLKRPLKRSSSQASSSSLHPEATSAAHPPLRFRPAFTGISMETPSYTPIPLPGFPSATRGTAPTPARSPPSIPTPPFSATPLPTEHAPVTHNAMLSSVRIHGPYLQVLRSDLTIFEDTPTLFIPLSLWLP